MQYNYFYKITNLINNKFYYGVHKTNKLNDNYLGSGLALGRSKKKYGKENFNKEILQFFDTYEECLAHEALIVNEEMVKNPMCYNMQTGGKGGKLSEESKAKIAAARKGKSLSIEHRAKIAAAGKGRLYTEESRIKRSNSLKGKVFTEEHLANMKVARENMSNEAKAKMGHIGKKHSEESKAKIGASRKIAYNLKMSA